MFLHRGLDQPRMFKELITGISKTFTLLNKEVLPSILCKQTMAHKVHSPSRSMDQVDVTMCCQTLFELSTPSTLMKLFVILTIGLDKFDFDISHYKSPYLNVLYYEIHITNISFKMTCDQILYTLKMPISFFYLKKVVCK